MRTKTAILLTICAFLACDAKADFFHHIRTERIESDPMVKWRNIGPGMSGYNEKIWTHPSDPNTIFLGPDMHVSYGSWDGGHSWISLKDYDELGQLMKRVLDIEFSAQNPDFAMALDWNGWLYVTEDRGRSWTRTADLSPDYRDRGADPYDPEAFSKGWYDEQIGTRLAELAVDPTDDSTWYVGSGDFWNTKENHRSIESPNGNILKYADYGYVLKTTDRGRTWTRMSNGLPKNLDVGRIVVDPLQKDHIIMATSHGLMQSHDGGLNWKNGASGLPNNLPRDLTYHFDEGTGEFVLYLVEQTVYLEDGDSVTSKGGVYQSVDGGKNWTNITGNLYLDLTQIHYPAEIDRYYRTLSNWFRIPAHDAKTRFRQLPDSVLPIFNRIVVNPLNRREIYLSYNKKHDRTFGPGDVWRSLDGGLTWVVVVRHGVYWRAGKDQDYWASRGNPTGPNVEFSHLQDYMDAQEESSGNRALAINSKGELFISIDQQTQKSSDQGASWQQIDDIETSPGSNKWVGRGNSNLPGRVMLLESGRPDRRLFASGEHGLWQTTAMNSWQNDEPVEMQQIEGQVHIDGMVSISTVAVHPNNPDIIYILAWRQNHRGKLRRTTDGGKTWENIATVIENSEREIDSKQLGQVIQGPVGMLPAQNSLTIDPVNPENMYFVATRDAFSEIYRAPRRTPSKGGFGFFKSTDGGYTWDVSNQGFHEGFSIRRLALDPANPAVIYAAANDEDGGLYKSTDQGSHWSRVEIPAAINRINNVFIDRNNKQLFISAGDYYDGAYEEGGAWRSEDSGKTWQRIFKAPVVLQVESSPLNPDLLLLVAGNQMRIDRQFMNPGIYLSLDRGNSWKKVNRNLGNNDKIIDAKPDPYHENLVWAASWGSGWFIGYIEGVRSVNDHPPTKAVKP